MKDTQLQHFVGSIEQYRPVLEEIKDIIMICDQSGKIEYVNRALRRTLGFKYKKFTGRNITDCVLFGKKMKLGGILKKIFSEKPFFSHTKNRSGELLHLAWNSKVFSRDGQKMVLAVVRDMTSHINLQSQVERYNKNLHQMVLQRTRQLEKEKQKAIELLQAKAIFLSKMSHELRTPLTAICGYVELLKEPHLTISGQSKYLAVIDRNAKGLLEMVNDSLRMIQIEQGKFTVNERVFKLKPLIMEILETYSILAREKGLKLDLEIKGEIPDDLYSDPGVIRQILINLIGNSVKFTSQGRIFVRILQRSLPQSKGMKLYFYVHDTGAGIPDTHHRRIFQLFEQYLEHQSVHGRGSGLGLAISKQLAKLIGGKLSLVFSSPHEGSIFLFSLPILAEPNAN